MPFWRCFYHIIWSTKQRAPTITAQNESIIFEAIRAPYSLEMGCQILAMNAVSDHIHVAVSIPPSLAVAEWVRSSKGVSSYQINTRLPDDLAHFRWQGGYSALTFGARNQAFVRYIQNQKQHHADAILQPYLEYLEED